MTLGLAINGGAIRCSYYIGFLQYIYEKKITIDEISALSSGVVAGLIYYSGESPKEIFDDFSRELSQNRLKPKIFSILLNNLLRKYYHKDEDILKLNLKLKIATTKIPKFKSIIFDNFSNFDDLFKIAEASCSLPYFFNFPVKFKNEYYIDGYFSERNLASYLTTKKKIFLFPFSISKNTNDQDLLEIGLGNDFSLKNILSTFIFNEDISNFWYQRGYSDALDNFRL